MPSKAEWEKLTDYLGDDAGGKLKATGTIEAGTGLWLDPNTGATNETGFTALPGGSRTSFGSYFGSVGNFGYWWSSTEHSTSSAWYRYMLYDDSNVYRDGYDKEVGYSVRCVRD